MGTHPPRWQITRHSGGEILRQKGNRAVIERNEAFDGGQPEFQVQAFPFRMTDENMAAHRDHQWYDFWRNLKEGSDYFEATLQQPKVNVCGKRYVFNASFAVPEDRIAADRPCPPYVPLEDTAQAGPQPGGTVLASNPAHAVQAR